MRERGPSAPWLAAPLLGASAAAPWLGGAPATRRPTQRRPCLACGGLGGALARRPGWAAPWLGGAPARQAASQPPGGPRGGAPTRRPRGGVPGPRVGGGREGRRRLGWRHPCSAPTWRRPCGEGGVGGGGLRPTRRRVVCSTCSTAPFIRARAQEPREGRRGSPICGDLASEKLRPRPCAAPLEGRRHPCITRAITSFCPHLTVTLTTDSRNGIEGIEVKF